MRRCSARLHSGCLSIAVLAALLGAAGCVDGYPEDEDAGLGEEAAAVTTSEGFEGASKAAYAAADVTLGAGVWNMNAALIGTLTTDVKTGSAAGRIRNTGRITMRFDRANAGTATPQHRH